MRGRVMPWLSAVLTSLSGCNEESRPLRRSRQRREARWYTIGKGYTQEEGRKRQSRSSSRNFLPFSTFPVLSLLLFALLSDSLNLSDHFVSLLQLRSARFREFDQVSHHDIKKLPCYSFCSHMVDGSGLFERDCDRRAAVSNMCIVNGLGLFLSSFCSRRLPCSSLNYLEQCNFYT